MCVLSRSPVVPPGLSVYPHTNVGPPTLPVTALPALVFQPLSRVPSTPPTGLDEYFFFNSLVGILTQSLVFWQFWLFFVFKFVVVLLLFVQGGKVYLSTYASILVGSLWWFLK